MIDMELYKNNYRNLSEISRKKQFWNVGIEKQEL